jgi:hypothetical protein
LLTSYISPHGSHICQLSLLLHPASCPPPCRPIQRFWVLETVARIPYFAYISILHMYESLGFWRAAAELRKIHFAEEWNELHHLQVSGATAAAAPSFAQQQPACRVIPPGTAHPA